MRDGSNQEGTCSKRSGDEENNYLHL